MATYLKRTCGSTASSYTVSMWVKTAKSSGTSSSGLFWNGATNKISWEQNASSQIYYYNGSVYRTTGYFRDVSGWYHIVWSVNAGTGTLYVNNESALIAGTASGVGALVSANEIQIGADGGSSTFEGIMSHVHFIDGTAYTPSAFGETDATTGEWKIKTSPSVTYGTNGFFVLKDGNSVTDQSGNSNNLTISGTLTNTEDCPSDVFATGNPLDQNGGMTFSEGNLTFASTSASWRSTKGTLGMTAGKYYWEVKVINTSGALLDMNVGVIDFSLASQSEYSTANPALAYNAGDGSKSFNGSNSSYGSSYTVGDIIGVAFDADNLTVEFFKNGTSQGVVNTGWSSGITWTPVIAVYGRYNNTKASANFGNGYFGTTVITSAGTNASNIGVFEYDVPTGYTALSTKGLNN